MALTQEQLRQIRVFTDRGFDQVEAIHIVEALKICIDSEEFKRQFGLFGVGVISKVLRGELKGRFPLADPPKRIDLGSL